MKKVFSLLIILAAFASCTHDVQMNGHTLQSNKDGVFWRGKDITATVDVNNALTIVVLNQYETLTLKTTSTYPGTYNLPDSDVKKATYTYANEGVQLNYSTANNGGNGQIVITEYDTINKTVTGTFKFNAINSDPASTAPEIVNFNYGGFYKLQTKLGY